MATDTPTCEAVHTVDDASFGYWNEAWGDSPVHEFPCGGIPTVLVTDPFDGGEYALCTECAPACFLEFGLDHEHGPAECARILYEMSGDPWDNHLMQSLQREAEEHALGRPLFPNEY